MTLDEIKEELIKRYKFINENAAHILAPFMHEETTEEIEESNKRRKKMNLSESNEPMIFLKTLDNNTLEMLEELLLSTIPLEQTEYYNVVKETQNNKDYLKKYKYGLELLEKNNKKKPNKMFILKLNAWKLLECVRNHIKSQNINNKTLENKIKCLDEYFRICRYTNDGKIWTGGYHLGGRDILENYDLISFCMIVDKNKPKRNKTKYTKITTNEFINTIANNKPFLTENEKQKIYLENHDELPWDLEIKCDIEEEYIPTFIETRLIRPEQTEPCHKDFYIKESEIFIRPNDILYKYYQLCPHCGFIVNIPKEILSEGIKKRIDNRCSNDDNLFRKMYLYSELKKLDDMSNDDQKKLLKTKK